MSTKQLTATYKSSGSTQTFSVDLPSLPSDSEAQNIRTKTAYLSALRSSIGQMQSDVNAFLTKKMEEEKASEAGKARSSQMKEAKEEEMYGEEDPEADG